MAKQKPTELLAIHPDVLINAKSFDQKEISECGTVLLNYMRSLDTSWDQKIQAMFEERGFKPEQVILLLAARTLEMNEYLSIPTDHEFFNTEHHTPAGTVMTCPECLNPYTLAYPSQPLCGNLCADTFYKRTIDEQAELRELARTQKTV